MKHLILVATLALISSESFARRCVPDRDGMMNFSSRCDVVVTGTSTFQCHIIRSGGPFPGDYDYKPAYNVHPWSSISTTDEASACDVDLQGCKDFAFRSLQRYEFTNNCGDRSVGKSVEFRYQELSSDGTVESETFGKFSK